MNKEKISSAYLYKLLSELSQEGLHTARLVFPVAVKPTASALACIQGALILQLLNQRSATTASWQKWHEAMQTQAKRTDATHAPLVQAALGLAKRFDGNSLDELLLLLNRQDFNPPAPAEVLLQYAAEGFGRQAVWHTPADVAHALWAIAGQPQHPVVHAPGGASLAWALNALPRVATVGYTTQNSSSRTSSDSEASINDWQTILGDVARSADSVLAALNDALNSLHPGIHHVDLTGKVVLVNACDDDVPFGADPEQSPRFDSRDALLESGASRVLALVPGSMLSQAQGPNKAAEVLDRCLRGGLQRVIALPAVLGRESSRYCILDFSPGEVSSAIDFAIIPATKDITRPAKSGFGACRRKWAFTELALDQAIRSSTGLPPAAMVERHTVSQLMDGDGPTQKPPRSFEPARLVRQTIFSKKRSSLTFKSLGELFDVHRTQHVIFDPTETGIGYAEIGAADLDEFGQLNSWRLTHVSEQSEPAAMRNALEPYSIILCVKGSVGKVAYIERFPYPRMMTNQSFVVLRPRNPDLSRAEVWPTDQGELASTASQLELIFWWMMSSAFRQMLANRTVSVGAPRVPVADLADLPIPVGPKNILAEQASIYSAWKQHVLTARVAKLKADSLRESGWCLAES